ncbi:hypothetical protein EYF80_006244 [Liparis tanakae]|uniref:Uncharacterized protein n=1 Tax=Liparis tanakae TaxID=230148 RepID=A0A4Z2J1F0_9TELE|nr:hypothetical protein EYF80_006244 [Liparis tanakae]
MVRFSITSGKFSSSAFSSSKVMEPLPSLSADSNSASVKSSSFSSGREMALSRRHDLSTTWNRNLSLSVSLPWIRRSRAFSSSSRLMEPLPSESNSAKKRSAKNDCREKTRDDRLDGVRLAVVPAP